MAYNTVQCFDIARGAIDGAQSLSENLCVFWGVTRNIVAESEVRVAWQFDVWCSISTAPSPM